MKQVRVTVVFEELDHNYQVVQKRYSMDTKFGAIARVDGVRPAEDIAIEMGELVYNSISTALPEFLKEQK